MGILKIKILAEDIKLDNYTSSEVCPITKALARAGRPDLIECVGIYVKNENGTAEYATEIIPECEYIDAVDKMFRMFKTLRPDSYLHLEPLPIDDIDFEVNIPEAYELKTLEIDEDTVKATQADFIEKK